MKGISKNSLILSVITAVIAGVVSVLQMDLWLAGTQWMMIAILFGVWSMALKDYEAKS